MSEIPNVIAGEPVESNWGNLVRSRSAQRYADATARDASVAIPETGELAWLDNPPSLTYYDGTAWRVLRSATDDDIRFVNVDGDTMTGPLVVPEVEAGILDASTSIDGPRVVYFADQVPAVTLNETYTTYASVTTPPAGDYLITAYADALATNVGQNDGVSMALFQLGVEVKETATVPNVIPTGNRSWILPIGIRSGNIVGPGNIWDLKLKRGGTAGTLTAQRISLTLERVKFS